MRHRNKINSLSPCSLQYLIMPCNREPQHISKITIFFIICIFRRGVDGLGHCYHVDGTLLPVEDFCRRGLKEHGEPVSCTSRLCCWNAPMNVEVDPKPVINIVITKNIGLLRKLINVPKPVCMTPGHQQTGEATQRH